MPMHIRAADVSRQLADAGHTRAEWDGDDWDPGYQCKEHGPRIVHVLHDGPGKQHHLDLYALALRNLGYTVQTGQQPDNGPPHLTITRP